MAFRLKDRLAKWAEEKTKDLSKGKERVNKPNTAASNDVGSSSGPVEVDDDFEDMGKEEGGDDERRVRSVKSVDYFIYNN